MTKYLWVAILILISLGACNSAAPATPEPDRVGTRVAEELAVSQTLTAVAKQAAPAVTEVARVEPTVTIEPRTQESSAPTETMVPPTLTVQATNVPPTKVPATRKPTVAAPKPPTPTKQAAASQQADSYVPGGGNPNGLIGKIYLPGYGEGPKVNHPSFNEEISIQLLVYDPDTDNKDGAGIKAVTFDITDPNGETVWSAGDQKPRYCAFGGDAGCAIWSFPPNGNRWPNGKPVCKGDNYLAEMKVRTTDPGRDNANWQFTFAIDGNYPPCQQN
jgi:hypothetical protein